MKKIIYLFAVICFSFQLNAQKISERHRAIEAARDNKDLYVRAMLTGTFHPDNRARCVPELESMIKDAQKLPFATIENSQRVMIDRPDRIADMRARKFPLYYFLGDQDSSLPADIMQNELMQMPGAVAHVLQGIGHMGHIESTRKSAEFIQRVLLADT